MTATIPNLSIDGELGIDVTRQSVGTIILIETEDDVLLELEIMIPDKSIVRVSGTEPRLKHPVLGILSHSFSGDKKTQIEHWIGMLLCLSLSFKNGSYETKPVVHASVKGASSDGRSWTYDVF